MSRHFFSSILAVALCAAAARAQPSLCTLPLLGADRLGPATELARQGQSLYLVAGGSLLSVDISDPAHPAVIGRLDLDFEVLELSVSGDVLAAAAGERGLVLFDLSDRAHPVRAAELDTPGYAAGVSSTPGRVSLADRRITEATVPRGVLILDVSDPFAPVELGAHPFGLWGANDVVVKGATAYALEYGGPLHLLDVSNPAATTELGSVSVPGHEIRVNGSGNRAYVYHFVGGHHIWAEVFLLDTSDRGDPRVKGSVFSWEEDGELFSSFAIGDGKLFLGDAFSAFWVYDVSDLDNPALLARLDEVPTSQDLVHFDGKVYAAAGEEGLQVIDVSHPRTPSLVASVPVPPRATGVSARGATAALRTERSVRLFDVTDPRSPRPIGGVPGSTAGEWGNPPNELGRVGDLLFVPEATGLRILDIGDPAAPAVAGRFLAPAQGLGIAAGGGLAYLGIADSDADSLRVLDVSDPAAPVELGSWGDTNWNAERIALLDGLLVATSRGWGQTRILDVSQPGMPSRLASIPEGHATALALDEELLYLTTYDDLLIFDLANPTIPVERGSIQLGSAAQQVTDLAVSHRRAAVALDGGGGMRVVDLRDPDAPVLVGEVQGLGDAWAIDFDHGRIHVADGRFGYAIYGDCPFFADGFESGDASAWSRTMP